MAVVFTICPKKARIPAQPPRIGFAGLLMEVISMTLRLRLWCPKCKAIAKKLGLACTVCATVLTAVPDEPHSHHDDPAAPQTIE
jgi:hypothetical protein